MRRNSIILIFFLLIVFIVPLFAQQNARVAVLPFSAVGVSENEAKVITSLFETSLVKTNIYNVIEQNQIKEILDAQAYSLSGCTDDSCAVEVGELLSAELIILGEFSHVGGRYIITAKIIDVEEGKNINADSVTADDITEMMDGSVKLLAYKLAGLTYRGGGKEQIADTFGELYVSTTPDNADIYVNGLKRGTSPLVVEKIPLGIVRITARKDNLIGENIVELSSADLLEVQIELKSSLGRLFIKSSEKEVNVFLDGKRLGPLAEGIFRDLESGEHDLQLKGNGLYWEGSVTIEADKTATVEAWPLPYGSIEYFLPDDVVCKITGSDFDESITEKGEIDLKVGIYQCRISGENYNSYSETILIEKGKTVRLEPKLEYTDEYQTYLAERKKKETKASLESKLKDLRIILEKENNSTGESLNELNRTRAIFIEEDTCGYVFPELKADAESLLKKAISLRIDELYALSSSTKTIRETMELSQWISFGVGTAGFVLSGVFKLIGDAEYETYLAAETSAGSEASNDKLSIYSVFQTCGLITGAVGTAGGGTLLFLKPNPDKYSAEIANLSAERAKLDGGIQ